jgi:hypothetical protein
VVNVNPLIALGLEKLIDAGANYLAKPKYQLPSRKEQLDKRIAQLDEIIQKTKSNPAIDSSYTGPAETSSYIGPAETSANGDVSTGCLPCARAHLSTISGTLKEALRFARSEGIMHPEVQSRLQTAEEDITIIERHDWTPEKILRAPEDERKLMREFIQRLRELRQKVMTISSVEDLEEAAARAGELAADLRLAVLKLKGVDTGKIIDLAQKVQAGEMTMEEAKEALKHEGEHA